jgi:phosphatidylglycerophosphate synthase
MQTEQLTRRPIRARDTRWAAACARFLARLGCRPNQISVASAAVGAISGACLWLSGSSKPGTASVLLVCGAVLVQVRLLCNLFDGMVAIEGGFKTKSGEIFNELPDRFADAFILIGAGYAAPRIDWMPVAGFVAAVLAVITAYVRSLGASAGASQQFCGPMAKQQRMFLVTLASVATAVLVWFGEAFPIIGWTLVVISAGCVFTIFRRTARIIGELERK